MFDARGTEAHFLSFNSNFKMRFILMHHNYKSHIQVGLDIPICSHKSVKDLPGDIVTCSVIKLSDNDRMGTR